MFKFLGQLFKGFLFAAIVLVMGQIVHIKDRTLSDQIKTGLARAENPGGVVDTAKSSAHDLIQDARDAVQESKAEVGTISEAVSGLNAQKPKKPPKPTKAEKTARNESQQTDQIRASSSEHVDHIEGDEKAALQAVIDGSAN